MDINDVFNAAGGYRLLARFLSLNPATVYVWRRSGRVPAEHVLAVEGKTGISRHILRPDVFGEHPKQAVQ